MKLNRADVKTPLEYSFLKETNTNVVLSTLKKAEDGDQFLLRFYNPTDTEKTAQYEFGRSINQAQLANLNEEPKSSVHVDNDKVEVNLKVNQVKNILF
ncbi:glycosyl hydrolase-related protein [Aquibacillus sp. 3ASR75-11]|uniref:Glycosyl hydrolase-related protein n=1 Tax=Terrihalobacillus insolitus TaxID=2950438 RepID=A0A9X3WU40_9BACI|nr:glycosyl hydrolase-related protein [Terrihalobacillus insolitus]MDC3411887.1 glycosyl hydrolase-related protein [Terrihalobacillus insolitus]MDC3423434.1 glycosyl hydrolase-related protein [Terrihalobacillus insolitus]